MRTDGWNNYAFFATGTASAEQGWITSSSSWGYDIPVLSQWDDIEFVNPMIWQCQYCGSKYWVEDKELKCKNCGATRDI